MLSPAITLLLLFFGPCCLGQATKEQSFKMTVRHIVAAFSKQDSTAMAPFIHKGTGLYQLDRTGAFDHYNHFKTLRFSDSTYPQVLFRQAKNVSLLPLQYASLPAWRCDKEVWSKKGLFVDTAKADHLLSTICKDRNKYAGGRIPAKTIHFFYALENNSRRIVLYDNKELELIFYLSYINGKWFLTVVDNMSSDCSV